MIFSRSNESGRKRTESRTGIVLPLLCCSVSITRHVITRRFTLSSIAMFCLFDRRCVHSSAAVRRLCHVRITILFRRLRNLCTILTISFAKYGQRCGISWCVRPRCSRSRHLEIVRRRRALSRSRKSLIASVMLRYRFVSAFILLEIWNALLRGVDLNSRGTVALLFRLVTTAAAVDSLACAVGLALQLRRRRLRPCFGLLRRRWRR